jgi:hypothetical protein
MKLVVASIKSCDQVLSFRHQQLIEPEAVIVKNAFSFAVSKDFSIVTFRDVVECGGVFQLSEISALLSPDR